ncbi:MAG: 4Fe-4S binding protein [Desulfovibrionaceae bacterium]|nr:4Fe-4S binding protein [Desulfovibrionaceae bacterium]
MQTCSADGKNDRALEKKGSKRSLLYWANRLTQWLSLAFLGEWAFYGVFRCPFVVPFISCQNCPILTCPGRVAHTYWGVWAVWLGVLVLFGRAFCGWICPGGLVSRLFSKAPTAKTLHPDAEKTFGYAKYLVLLFCLLVYFFMNQPRANIPIRIGEFWPAVLQTCQFASDLWLLRSATLVLLILSGAFILLAWCRFACPMGAILELLKSFSLFHFTKTDQCNGCNACKRICPMHTRPDEANCTNCGDCQSICPQKAIDFRFRFK